MRGLHAPEGGIVLIAIDHGGTYTDLWAQEGLRRFHTKVATTPDDLGECVFDGLQDLSGAVYGRGDLSGLLARARTVCYASSRASLALQQGRAPRLGLVGGGGLQASEVACVAAPCLSFENLVGGRFATLDESTVGALANPGSSAWAACAAVVLQVLGQLTAQGAERVVVSLGNRSAEIGFMKLALRGSSPHLLGHVPLACAAEFCADADLPRATWTALLNACLHPAVEHSLCSIEDKLHRLGCSAPLLVLGSDGLAARVSETAALRTLGAGTQAALRGAAALARAYGVAHLAVLEIGASHTHFATIDEGRLPLCGPGASAETGSLVGLARLRSMALGGHSLLRAEGGSVRVGPASTGALPGPACFGRGGGATLTDLKLVQGQIEPRRYFAGRMALHVVRAEEALMAQVARPLGLSLDAAVDAAEMAWADTLAGALKSWVHPASVLCAYGGAGPLEACAVAQALGLKRVLVPGAAAVFGASSFSGCEWGTRHELAVGGGWDLATAQRALAGLVARAGDGSWGGARPGDSHAAAVAPDFQRRWWWSEADTTRELDLASLPRALVRRQGAAPAVLSMTLSLPLGEPGPQRDRRLPALAPRPGLGRRMRRAGRVQEVPLLLLGGQPHGARGEGPVLIEDDYFSLPVPAGWHFRITLLGDVDLHRP